MTNKKKFTKMKKSISIFLIFILVFIPILNCTVCVFAEENLENNIPPNSYARGLKAWYDGTSNTRNGSDINSSVWEDLIGGHDLTINKNSDNFFNEEGLHVKSAKHTFPKEITDIVNGDSFTVEILLGDFTSIGQDYNTIMNSSNDNFALFRRNSDDTLEFKFAANTQDARPKIPNAQKLLPFSLITVTYEVGGNCSLYINGNAVKEKPASSKMGANDLFIGHVNEKDFETTFKSIRFYDRALSLHEILHNAAVDGYFDVRDLYIKDGLVSLYSGISNTEEGYDASATTWSDLIGENDITLTIDDKNYFTREGFHLNSSAQHFPSSIVDTVNGNEFTVEMVLGNIESLGSQFNTFINSTNDNFSLFRRINNDALEFKFAANGVGERPTASEGLDLFENSTVSITYKVGEKTRIYVDGVKIAEANSPKAMGANDLFFGHAESSRNYDTTFRSIRFYNRALAASEIALNAQNDAVSTTDASKKSPSFVTIAQPKTNIAGDIALVRSIESTAEFNSAMSLSVKPAAVILHTDAALNITSSSGNKIGTVQYALDQLDYKVMAVFEVNDELTVDALCAYLKTQRFYDCFIMSKNASLIKRAKGQIPSLRGIIDYSETYKNKETLSKDDLKNIRKSVHSNDAVIAVLPQKLATRENIQYLYDRIVNVWVDTTYPATDAEKYESILSGAIGVISDDTVGLYNIASKLAENTVTRMPLNIGHRGLPSSWPENTLEGAIAAYEAGANVIEIDIYLTTDGEIVIMHDGNTGRTCNKDISVEGSTLAKLKELYVNKGYENKNGKNKCKIPTLREYLEYFKDKDCEIFIEIKSNKNDIVPKMKALIDEYDMYANCAVITFVESQMSNMRKFYPEMSVGALCGGYLDETDSDSDMRSVMSFIGKYNATLNPSYSGYGQNAIRAALLRGIGIYPWTFERNSGNDYFKWGYSGITTNTANVFGPSAKKLTIQTPDKASLVTGKEIELDIKAATYGRDNKDVSANVNYKILSGENIVTAKGSKLSFTGEGDIVIIAYYENQSPMKYTVYSDIISLHIEKAEDIPGNNESTEIGTESNTESSKDTNSAEEDTTEPPVEKKKGCKSSAGLGLILTIFVASASFITYKKKS